MDGSGDHAHPAGVADGAGPVRGEFHDVVSHAQIQLDAVFRENHRPGADRPAVGRLWPDGLQRERSIISNWVLVREGIQSVFIIGSDRRTSQSAVSTMHP